MIFIDMITEIGVLLTYAFVIFAIYFFGYIFLVPLKFVFKLILNSILGGVFLIVLNLFGTYLGFHIPVNFLSSLVVGILGVPGTGILLVFQLI